MKNFKEFVKEQNENTLDEGIMDMLKGLGKGIVGAVKGIGKGGAIGARLIGKGAMGTAKGAGAIGGALAGGAKAGFRVIGGGGGGESGHSSHKYDTWKKDAKEDAEKNAAKENAKKLERRQELTKTVKRHGTALGFDMSSGTGRAQHESFMHRLHDTSHPDHGKMEIHSSGMAWDKSKNGGSGAAYGGAAGIRPGVRTQSSGEHEEAKNAYMALKKDREESGL